MTSVAFSGTVSRDFSAAIDLSRSVVNDLVLSAEIGRTSRRDDASPLEIGSGATVILNSAVPIEWTVAFSGALSGAPTEWRASLLRSAVAASEWRVALSSDGVVPAAWGLLVAVPSMIPAETNQTTVAAMPGYTEWRAPVARNAQMPAETVLAVAANVGPVPVAMGTTALLDVAVPGQFQLTILRDDVVGFESGASTSVGVFGDACVPIEWRGVTVADSVVAIGTGANSICDSADAAEWSGGIIGSYGDMAAPIGFGVGTATSNIVYEESSQTSVTDELIPADATATFVVEATVVTSYVLSLSADTIVSFGVTVLQTADSAAPAEWRTNLTTGADSIAFGFLQEVTQDVAGVASWTTTISADVLALIETSVTTQAQSADTASPIEWKSSLSVAVTVSDERWFDRKSIGASLEPDEWEEDHGDSVIPTTD